MLSSLTFLNVISSLIVFSFLFFFFSSRRRHTRCYRDWSSDVCSSDLYSERVIRENFLLPFQAAVQEGHVGSVMASYNEIDGIPSHINYWLLAKVLRQEWGFRGFVTSDGDGLQMLVETHHVAATKADAARLAIAAGVEYDLSDGSVYRTLLDQVQRGIVPPSQT